MTVGKKKRKWVRIVGIISLLLLVGIGIYGYMFYKSLHGTLEKIHEPIERKMSEKRIKEVILPEKDPISILMLGVDERAGDKGRSDSMIVLTINPKQESVKMLSIPRDTRTEIVGHGTIDKINHAYAFGGVEMAINSVENLLDIPIDYYMQINMESFKDIVDAVGGITVNNDFKFSYGGFNFNEGQITLNGEQALAFSRMRKADPRGDFGRQFRQRLIIQGVIREGASLSSIANYNKIFESLGNNLRTNLTFSDMIDIQKHYKQTSSNIEHITVQGSGTMINGIYYYQLSDQEIQRIQYILKTHLELKKAEI